ncbi:unnamed protein product [Phyllotreta striolata]|uniref:hydroxymethylbilane synthase n=1 Tax=Phyllotreta striolata TaxID=444603 RepID=A0A9N9XP28_PHYSR|nr:unnamed protein product [Phyllotreta striolata]
MSENQNKIRVGSRKSELALVQTKYVISLLKDCFPDKEFEIVTMNTLGDTVLDIALPKIGEKSLFTKELETALALGTVDFVVHSLKDLPTCLPEGMAIGAVLSREDPRDALVLQKNLKSSLNLSNLPENSVIGTSSLRRTAQLAKNYPHLKVENIRGNLNTRLKKLDDLGKYQAIILAAAGLIRIGWKDRISKVLSEDELLYAVGQGALAVECRADNSNIIKLLESLYHLETALRVTAERAFLRTLGGGCSAPVAVSSHLKAVEENQFDLVLKGAVWSLDGKEEILDTVNTTIKVKTDLRCASCPRRDKSFRDIENLDCGKCQEYNNGEPVAKKIKFDDIPSVLLKTDRCPVQLPVGSDFMAKCPYLEHQLDGSSENLNLNMSQCPFLLNKSAHIPETIIGNSSKECFDDDNLFCGLVLHKQATLEGMTAAKELGVKLAKKLIANGALDIMKKAQAIVHGKSN